MKELFPEPPTGLISCRIKDVQAHIMDISPFGAKLRIAERFDEDAPIEFFFYRGDGGLEHVRVNARLSGAGSHIYALTTDDAAFAGCVRAAQGLYAEYITCRMTDDRRGAEALLTDAPKAGNFARDMSDQYAHWYERLRPWRLSGKEIYVLLDRPELWNCLLHADDFWKSYAAAFHIPRAALPERMPDGVYLGSEYCAHLFPGADQLNALMRRAQEMKLRFALATSEAVDGDVLCLAARYQTDTEVLINDWGMLERVRNIPDIVPVLGTRLNRQRKDPRMGWRRGMDRYSDLQSQNALNVPAFRKLLAQYGIARCEYEICGMKNAAVGQENSLHLPLCHTNASRLCTLRAMCERGDRGYQFAEDSCPMYCADNACIYPERYSMIGRGNAIVAYYSDFYEEAARDCYDRVVLNF